MLCKGFRIVATPSIMEAYCKCGNELREVSSGFLGTALYCPKCENVYEIKLVKAAAKNVSERFLQQCRDELEQRKK